ncbi:MAG TPA: terminase [Granulicella sp.]
MDEIEEKLASVPGLTSLAEMLDERWDGIENDNGSMRLAQKVLRVRDREGHEQPLQANRAQSEFERQRKQHNIILKARQMGMTTWASGRFFLKTITTPGTLTVQVAQTREAAESMFRIAQRFWENLPEGCRTGPLKRSRANKRQMIFPALDSEFRVVSAADVNAGRGLTIQNLHCSELSRWRGNPRETLAGLRAALAPGGELILESTPNGAVGCFYDEWMQAAQSGLAAHFFPWWLEDSYVTAPVTEFTDDEQELMQLHRLTPEQIGFRRQLAGSYRGLRAQEFAEDPARCFRASGNCCFEIEAIEERMLELTEPVKRRRHGALLVWLPPMPGREYIVGVDPAGGSSDGDYSVAQVIELQTGTQCAELRDHLSPMELARAIAELAKEYNGALVAVERNFHGAAVHAFLDTTARYERIYTVNGERGFLTSSASKPEILSRLGALLVERPGIFNSRRLLAECRTFVHLASGGAGAAPGAHDDCVMAMAIAQHVRSERILKRR